MEAPMVPSSLLKHLRLPLWLALAALVATAAFARPSNKWRIQCSEGAKSDGVIVFHLQPEGGTVQVIEVSVAKGTGENAVARRIRDVFREQLSPERYHVEVDDGEDVLVKKKGSTPNFDLRVESNSVKAVRINMDRE